MDSKDVCCFGNFKKKKMERNFNNKLESLVTLPAVAGNYCAYGHNPLYTEYKTDFLNLFGLDNPRVATIIKSIEVEVLTKKEIDDRILNKLTLDAVNQGSQHDVEFISKYYMHLRELQRIYAISTGVKIKHGFRMWSYMKLIGDIEETVNTVGCLLSVKSEDGFV